MARGEWNRGSTETAADRGQIRADAFALCADAMTFDALGLLEYGYAAFGIPEVAMKQMDANTLVISPYSTFLALTVEPSEAIRNLRCMNEFEWTGRYGFFEAVD